MDEGTLCRQIGQRLVTGFPGREPDREFVEIIKTYQIGNIILFRHNIESEEQLTGLCARLRRIVLDACGIEPFIMIDQEGGMVSRLPDEGCNPPGAMAVAAAGDEGDARRTGLAAAAILRRCGVNMNLAPVLDISSNPDHPGNGVRSFGDTAETVSRYGIAEMLGMQEGGIAACVKHFPGCGAAEKDSHLTLPRIGLTLEELEARELRPFREAAAKGAEAVMVSHCLFSRIDPRLPATMSPQVIRDLLRDRVGCRGLLLSDCMEMGAIAEHFGVVEGAAASLKAGMDIVMTSHQAGYAARIAQRMLEEARAGCLDLRELEESAGRIMAAKNRRRTPPDLLPDRSACRQWLHDMKERSLTLVRAPEGGVPPLGDCPVFIGCRDYRNTLAENRREEEFSFAGLLREQAGRGTAVVISHNPGPEEIARVASRLPQASCLVFGSCNAHLYRGQLDMIHMLAAKGIPMIVAALRDPYDLRGLPEEVCCVAAWEYTRTACGILSRFLAGTLSAGGKLPLRNFQNLNS